MITIKIKKINNNNNNNNSNNNNNNNNNALDPNCGKLVVDVNATLVNLARTFDLVLLLLPGSIARNREKEGKKQTNSVRKSRTEHVLHLTRIIVNT